MAKNYNKISWNELAYEWENERRRLMEKFKINFEPRNNESLCGFYSTINENPKMKCRATTKIPSEEVCRTCPFFRTYEEVKHLNEDLERYVNEGKDER